MRTTKTDHAKPIGMLLATTESGVARATLSVTDMLVRGTMSGASLGIAASLAVTGAMQRGVPFAGALIFPIGLMQKTTVPEA